jgi:hypothetical protein
VNATSFKFMAVAYAAASFLLIHVAYNKGPVYTYFAVLSASTVPMILTYVFIEHRLPLDPSRQSWAFEFGDAIFLPLAGAMIALLLRHDHTDSFLFSWWWQIIAIAGGIVFALGFRAMDKPSYTELQYDSPAKIVHEFIAYPVLASVLIWGIPLLWTSFWGFGGSGPVIVPILAVFGGVAWLGCGIADGTRGLDPHYLHPEWSWSQMALETP